MKPVFIFFIFIHGLIHILGFVKAFELADVSQLTRPISKSTGLLWLFMAILFLGSIPLFLFNNHAWWVIAVFALVSSQFLIIQSWTDAKFGTIANIIIFIPALVSFFAALPSSYQNHYSAEVQKRLHPVSQISLVNKEDIQHLPAPVQKYLEYAGAMGKPKVHNFRAVNRGSMKRSLESDWMEISVQQYNFFDDQARLFYIESSIYGIPFDGLHAYVGNTATMQIKVASMFQIVDAKGEKMNQGETVTMFNDMCCLAPATLIDKRIQWETIDSLRVKARFTNQENSITAILIFNGIGQLTDFISNDRFLSADGVTYESYPWSTPIKDYKDFNGRIIPTYGEAIWHMPAGNYTYAKFSLVEIEYNCKEFR